jgi:hypothetical protein
VSDRFASAVIRLPRSWVFLILIAGLFGSAQSASASCGHYVHSERPSREQDIERQTDPAPPHAPCRGPNCQRGEHTPPVPPVTSPTPNQEQALLVFIVPADDGAGSGRFTAPPHVHAIHHAFPPERPPRS